MPAALTERIHQQVARLLAEDANQQLIFKMGLEPSVSGPAEFGAFIRSEIDKWTRVVRETGIPTT
jgi:tripartite-type tricarboxylate transporter receptor subunit TctC